jgi:hypothetical protein
MWRSLNPDNGLRLPKLYARAKNFSRTADSTSEREREPKVSEKNYAFIVVATEISEPTKMVSVRVFDAEESSRLLAEESAPNYQGNGLQRAVRKAFDQLLTLPTINDLIKNEEESK